MESRDNQESLILTKREFLKGFASVSGISAVMAALDAWDMSIASAATAPPALSGTGDGTRVLILGAGIAGLTTAYELTERGYDCRIIEARSFAGGRCQTARNGFRLDEAGGQTQVCEFDEGQWFNTAAWRIPAHHKSLFHYCREFGIPMQTLISSNESTYLLHEDIDGPLAGRRVRRREVMMDMRGHTSELLAKLAHQGALDAELSGGDKEQLIEYLVAEGYLDPNDLAYKGTTERGWAVDFAGPLEPGQPSEALALKELLQSGLGNTFSAVSSFERPYTMLQPVGGMDRIPAAFEERVGHLITYRAEVQELRQTGQEVQVHYRDSVTGDTATATGDYCVTTIPLAVMRNIPNDLSDRCKAAIAAATQSQVGKLALQMNRRFWEEDDAIFGGSSQTDTSGGSLIYPSHGFLGRKGIVQGYYVFGGTAESVGSMDHGQRTERGLANGEKLHPGQFRRHYDGKSISVDWQRVPYSLGGWESWSDDARREHFPVLLEPQGRVYFAGAYLSYLTGWQAGAVESAWYQVERLHANAVTV